MPLVVFWGQECRNWRGVACAILCLHLHAQTVPCKGNRIVDKGRQEDTKQGAVALSKRKYLLNKTKQVFCALL